MSKEDLKVFQVIEKYRQGLFSRQEAALKLGVTIRTISRKAKVIREKGLERLVHGNRGRQPKNKKNEDVRRWYVSLYKNHYYDFNFLHAYEFICERHEPPERVCYDTFRGWLRVEGLGKTRKRRTSKARIARERHAEEGLMLQLDGSPHPYNGKDVWTLINVIDDATSKLLGAEFHPSETTFACMKVIRQIIEEHGVPEFILTDCAGWSKRIGKRAHFSQFARACEELGITIIPTPSAPSKGRVERSFRTSQDRLVAELRLEEIKTMDVANRYLNQFFKPRWNEKFAVEPRNETKRFRPVPPHLNLEDVFCLKQTRMVNRDHTISYEGSKYRLTEPPKNLHKHQVTVLEYETGELKFLYGTQELPFEKMRPYERPWKNAG